MGYTPAPTGSNSLNGERAARVLRQRIARVKALPPGVSADEAAAAVLRTLSRRLSRGEARDLAGSLPAEFGKRMESSVQDRAERPEVFGRDEFYQRVAGELGISTRHAEEVVRRVFAAVKEMLPAQEDHDIDGQLPRDLKDIWRRG